MSVQAILEHLLHILVGRIHRIDIEVEYDEWGKSTICRAIGMHPNGGQAEIFASGEGDTWEAALNGAILNILHSQNRWFIHKDVTEIFLKLCEEEDYKTIMEQPFSMDIVRKFCCSDPKLWQNNNWPA